MCGHCAEKVDSHPLVNESSLTKNCNGATYGGIPGGRPVTLG